MEFRLDDLNWITNPHTIIVNISADYNDSYIVNIMILITMDTMVSMVISIMMYSVSNEIQAYHNSTIALVVVFYLGVCSCG